MSNKKPVNTLDRHSLTYKILNFKELTVIIPTLILIIIGIAVNPNFMNKANWWAMLRTASFMGIVTIPVAFLLMTKSMDLSVGQVVASSGLIFAIMCCRMNVPIPLAFIIIMIYGALIGFINGFLVVDIGVPSFLVTLSMQFILYGISSQLVKGVSVTGFPEWFGKIGEWQLFNFITVEMIIFVIVVIIGHLFLTKTVSGRQLLMVGTNDRTAELCGMKVRKIRRTAHILTSALAALSAVLFCARTMQATPTTGGEWDLQLMIAAMIGGTSNYGGRGSVIGAMIGIIYMRILLNVLIMIGLGGDWQFVGMGVSMIFAIVFDYWRTKVTMTQLR
jgi:ribose transport system permease protein